MVTAYYAKNWGGNAYISNKIWHACSHWSVTVHDTFWDWRDVRCHGNSILFQKLKHKTFHKQFKRNWVYMLALRCRCARNFFKNGGKCVAMVTTYANNWGGKAFLKSNLAHMFTLKCKCVGHIWGQWQNVCCHGNSILFKNWKTKHTVTQWITARGGGINHLQWGFFFLGGWGCVCVCVCGCECKKTNMWHYTVDNWENCNVTRTISGGSLYWKMVIDNHDQKKVVYIPLIIAKQIMHPSKKGNATRLQAHLHSLAKTTVFLSSRTYGGSC